MNPGSNKSDQIRLSLVVATLRRRPLLEKLLDSAAAQMADPKTFEIIVVDNAPEPDEEVNDLCQSEKYKHLNLTALHNPVPGLSSCRNTGTPKAQADYIAYIDDDAYLPETWIESALQIQKKQTPDIYGGPYQGYCTSESPAWLRDDYISGRIGVEAHWLKNREYLFGTNITVKKDIYQKMGGFSPMLGVGTVLVYGEETDFQHRALQKGAKIWYDPALMVYHHTNPKKMSLGWLFRDRWIHGRVKAYIFRSEQPARGLRQLFSWMRSVAVKAIGVAAAFLGLLFRDREKYPYYQNYVIEEIGSRVSGLSVAYYSLQYDRLSGTGVG